MGKQIQKKNLTVYPPDLSGKHVSKGEALQKTMKITKFFPHITDVHTSEDMTAMRTLELSFVCVCVYFVVFVCEY